MYFFEKNDMEKNRYILWMLFFMIAGVADLGWKILRILEKSQ